MKGGVSLETEKKKKLSEMVGKADVNYSRELFTVHLISTMRHDLEGKQLVAVMAQNKN